MTVLGRRALAISLCRRDAGVQVINWGRIYEEITGVTVTVLAIAGSQSHLEAEFVAHLQRTTLAARLRHLGRARDPPQR